MMKKLPYYMAYPMPLLYDDERQNQRDYEYMKSVASRNGKASDTIYRRGMRSSGVYGERYV